MTGPKRPDLTVAWKNRRILAKRLDWPDGALEACERIEREHRDWAIAWLSENRTKGFERPAGYWAKREGMHAFEVYATDADELVRMIGDAPPAEHEWGVEGCAACATAYQVQHRAAGAIGRKPR